MGFQRFVCDTRSLCKISLYFEIGPQYPLFFTRHRGRGWSHVLPACGLWGKTLLAAGLAGLLLHLVRHPLPHQGQSWELVLLASSLYPLLKSLGVLVRSTPNNTVFVFLSWPLHYKIRRHNSCVLLFHSLSPKMVLSIHLLSILSFIVKSLINTHSDVALLWV